VKLLAGISGSDEQRFGVVLAVALGLLAMTETFKGASKTAGILPLAGSLLAAVLTIRYPKALRPLNEAWQRLGKLLGLIVSPIVLGIIFFGLLTPLAVTLRLFGRDELHLRRQPKSSYWTDCKLRPPPGDSFKRPF